MPTFTHLEEFLSKPSHRRIYEQERLMMNITDTIHEQLELQKRNQNFLADRMGRSRGFVSQILSGKRNMTLRTVSDLYWALNLRLVPKAAPIYDTVVSTSVPNAQVQKQVHVSFTGGSVSKTEMCRDTIIRSCMEPVSSLAA